MKLRFHPLALKEFKRLEASHKAFFRKKLKKLLTRQKLPLPRNRLRGFEGNCYKIKLKAAGLRLVYHYEGERLTILVLAVGKRERNIVYEFARTRS